MLSAAESLFQPSSILRLRFTYCLWFVQFERKVIPEAQKAVQTVKRNAILDEANARLSAQVQVSNEKAKRCERSALKWQDQLDIEKAAHRSVLSATSV